MVEVCQLARLASATTHKIISSYTWIVKWQDFCPSEADDLDTATVVMDVDEMKTRMFGERIENRRAETDDERDDDENTSHSPRESLPSTNETPSKKTHLEDGSDSLHVTKNAVVVLTRLPEYKISALRPPTPQQFYSEDESLSSSDSDTECEPEG